MPITKSKIFEVYEQKGMRGTRLYTKNLTPQKRVYGEQLVVSDDGEYREWDPYKSKICSAILKGAPNIFIRNNDVVLYLGASTGTTVSHVSDIVGKDGLIFAVDIAPRVMRELVFLSYERKNIVPILLDAAHVEPLATRICLCDVLFQDVAQKNQIDIFLKNFDWFVKASGYGLLAVKSRSIDVTKRPAEIFRTVKMQLEKQATIVDIRLLEPFQKDHALFMCKKRG